MEVTSGHCRGFPRPSLSLASRLFKRIYLKNNSLKMLPSSSQRGKRGEFGTRPPPPQIDIFSAPRGPRCSPVSPHLSGRFYPSSFGREWESEAVNNTSPASVHNIPSGETKRILIHWLSRADRGFSAVAPGELWYLCLQPPPAPPPPSSTPPPQ